VIPPLFGQLVAKAAKTAGGWLLEKAQEASVAALKKARELSDAVENAARTGVRRAEANLVDTLSEPVANASEAYQDAKLRANLAREQVNAGVARVKTLFGLNPPQNVARPCTRGNCSPSGPPPDGSMMVPSDDCENDFVPIPGDDNGGVPAAIATAKAKSTPSKSKCCEAKSTAERSRTIFYVNGINTTPTAHCQTLRMIRDQTCAKIVGVMNSSEGKLTDAMRTGDARAMIKSEIGGGAARTYAGFTPAVKTMQDVVFFGAAKGETVEIYAHSEGGAITSLATIRAKAALEDADLPSNIGNVTIVSMGSAAPAWPDGPKYLHYLHDEDPVPSLLGLGDAARRPGVGAKIVRFGGRNGDYHSDGDNGFKRSWIPVAPGKDKIADHYADTSYLPFMNQSGGCFGKP
jgi:hypothetical protein